MEQSNLTIIALFAALTFMLIHLLMPKAYPYFRKNQGKVFSFFGGITAAYVFLDLLPKLELTRTHFESLFGGLPNFVYSIIAPTLAFIGFMIFFALEHLAQSRDKNGDNKKAFGLHLGNIIFINIVIGYILRFEADLSFIAVLLYTAILSLHFITLDKSMEEHYDTLYRKFGRYIAAAAPLIGWGLSSIFPENQSEGYLLLAFVVGVVLFNSIKNEVPEGKSRNIREFMVGALISGSLIIIIVWLRG